MKKPIFHYFSIGIVLLYLFVPLLATLLYSLSTEWNKTILPEGLTLGWFADLYSDSRFLESFGRSLLLTGGTMIAAILIMVPAIFSIVVYSPRLERYLQAAIVITYAMPGVIMAVGLLRAYSSLPLPMTIVVAGAYFVSVLPYMYQGVRNSIRTVQADVLMEAAELLGASRLTAFAKVIVPNIMPGILVSALLSLSVLFGEFVLINMIVGGRFETVQIYLFALLSKSGHLASAIVVSYFLLMALLSLWIVRLSERTTRLKKGI